MTLSLTIIFEVSYLQKLGPFFDGSMYDFGKRYEDDLKGRSQTTFTRPPTPLRLHFLWYNSLQKVDIFDHLPPPLVNVVCERPLS